MYITKTVFAHPKPPDKQFYLGQDALYKFFGGDNGRGQNEHGLASHSF